MIKKTQILAIILLAFFVTGCYTLKAPDNPNDVWCPRTWKKTLAKKRSTISFKDQI